LAKLRKVKWSPIKWKILLSTAVAGIGLCALVFGFKAWKTLRQPIPELEFPKQEIPDIPGSLYLRNVPTLDDIHLLDGDFKIVRRVNEVLDACMSSSESSFVIINGLHAKRGEVRFANPGESFNWSDAIEEDLPFRRLEFAGLSTSECFIHYQSGGQPSSFCLAVINTANHRIIVGEYEKAAKNLHELRRMLHQWRFRDGRGC
jgi:hypothetical protein